MKAEGSFLWQVVNSHSQGPPLWPQWYSTSPGEEGHLEPLQVLTASPHLEGGGPPGTIAGATPVLGHVLPFPKVQFLWFLQQHLTFSADRLHGCSINMLHICTCWRHIWYQTKMWEGHVDRSEAYRRWVGGLHYALLLQAIAITTNKLCRDCNVFHDICIKFFTHKCGHLCGKQCYISTVVSVSCQFNPFPPTIFSDTLFDWLKYGVIYGYTAWINFHKIAS